MSKIMDGNLNSNETCVYVWDYCYYSQYFIGTLLGAFVFFYIIRFTTSFLQQIPISPAIFEKYRAIHFPIDHLQCYSLLCRCIFGRIMVHFSVYVISCSLWAINNSPLLDLFIVEIHESQRLIAKAYLPLISIVHSIVCFNLPNLFILDDL